jgi:hypothetical protein
MKTKREKTKADLLVSTRARLAKPLKTVLAGKIADSEKVNVPAGCKLVPLGVLNAQLRRAERDLRFRQIHPEDAVIYGVPEELARPLTVAAARTPSRQQDMSEADLDGQAAAETEAVRAAEARLKPVITLARKQQLNAEDLVAAARGEGGEAVGLKRFLSFGSDATSISDDEHVHRAIPEPLPASYDAGQSYQLKIKVKDFHPQELQATVVLAEVPLDCPLFTKKDVGTRRIYIKSINNETDLLLLGLLAAYKVPAVLTLKLIARIGAGKLAFSGTLCSSVSNDSTLAALRDAMRSKTMELFAEVGK